MILGCKAESCYTEGLTQERIKLQANSWLEGPGVVTTPRPLYYNKHQFHFKFLQIMFENDQNFRTFRCLQNNISFT